MNSPAQRLKQIMAIRGYASPSEAARAVKVNLNTLTSYANGNRPVSRKGAELLAEKFGTTAGWILYGEATLIPTRQVPLKGYVGAGGEIEAMDAGDLGTVDAPAEADPATIAAEVRGLSMLPAYEEGTVIYWSRVLPPEAMVNRRCVVQLGDGRIMVKTLKRGAQGLWTLQSVNPAYPDIEDVQVEWVAKIDWTKPL